VPPADSSAASPRFETLTAALRANRREDRQLILIDGEDDQRALTFIELERRALRLISRARLPQPEVNVRLHGYEVDLLWRDARLVVELDGSAYHDPERDTRKTANLMAHGWAVMRFTWRQVVNDPAWVRSRLAAWRRSRPGAGRWSARRG
jgi:very-short-patch-repair endonuclease